MELSFIRLKKIFVLQKNFGVPFELFLNLRIWFSDVYYNCTVILESCAAV